MALVEPQCPSVADGPSRLRARLEAARFGSVYPGHLPIVAIGAESLADVNSLEEAFARVPPLDLPGGGAWVAAVARALTATQPVPAPSVRPRRRWSRRGRQAAWLLGGLAAAMLGFGVVAADHRGTRAPTGVLTSAVSPVAGLVDPTAPGVENPEVAAWSGSAGPTARSSASEDSAAGAASASQAGGGRAADPAPHAAIPPAPPHARDIAAAPGPVPRDGEEGSASGAGSAGVAVIDHPTATSPLAPDHQPAPRAAGTAVDAATASRSEPGAATRASGVRSGAAADAAGLAGAAPPPSPDAVVPSSPGTAPDAVAGVRTAPAPSRASARMAAAAGARAAVPAKVPGTTAERTAGQEWPGAGPDQPAPRRHVRRTAGLPGIAEPQAGPSTYGSAAAARADEEYEHRRLLARCHRVLGEIRRGALPADDDLDFFDRRCRLG